MKRGLRKRQLTQEGELESYLTECSPDAEEDDFSVQIVPDFLFPANDEVIFTENNLKIVIS